MSHPPPLLLLHNQPNLEIDRNVWWKFNNSNNIEKQSLKSDWQFVFSKGGWSMILNLISVDISDAETIMTNTKCLFVPALCPNLKEKIFWWFIINSTTSKNDTVQSNTHVVLLSTITEFHHKLSLLFKFDNKFMMWKWMDYGSNRAHIFH